MKTYSASRLVMVILACAALPIIILFSQPGRAAGPWYVAPGGNDNNNCLSSTTACATINGALDKPDFIAGDTILVATGVYTGTGDQVALLNKSVTLSGGWDASFTAQDGTSTIDGEGARRGIRVETIIGPISTVIIERFVVQNCSCQCFGSGISNEGFLTLNYSTIKNNVTVVDSGNGGGISNSGSTSELTLNNSTVSGNIAEGGGGIDGNGIIVLNNSTVSGNTARGGCGGISFSGGTYQSMTLNNSTVSGNVSENIGGICSNGGSTLTMQNSILAGNTGGNIPDCYGAISSAGYNLIGNTAGCTFNSTTGDLTNVDPKLGPLEGSPRHYPLLPDSLAVNGGNPTGCKDEKGNPLPTDQRGFPRFGRCDIGAYELQPIGFATKKVDPPNVAPGDLLTYTIVLTNGGATNLTNVHLTDTVPAPLAYVGGSLSATSGSYGYNRRVITWTGSVNAGEMATITFKSAANQTIILGTQITNSVIISGGGEILTRTAIVAIPPATVFLPCIVRNYSASFFDNFATLLIVRKWEKTIPFDDWQIDKIVRKGE
ncbi:MAG: DUF11 domain-containing protein [Anaerolineae bacterium]|nr:DUF11 domain-containing protein [Anaerolineae bacterium]